MIIFHVVSIFPDIIPPYFRTGVLGRAQQKKIFQIQAYDLRDWTQDRHRKVDDTPYGGGAGMILKVEPLYRALSDIQDRIKKKGRKKARCFLLSAKGQPWRQSLARRLTKSQDIILICGRYEGVDERINHFINGEISVGPYVLSGGELPAMIIADSIARLLPGVLGNEKSPLEESHSRHFRLEYPQYTRPEIFTDKKGRQYPVPPVLLSGHHGDIAKWRQKQQKKA